MRSRLAEGGALAMRLSLVYLNAARRGAAFFAVEATIKISLPSPNRSVDQRKSSSWHARIGLLIQRRRGSIRKPAQLSRGSGLSSFHSRRGTMSVGTAPALHQRPACWLSHVEGFNLRASALLHAYLFADSCTAQISRRETGP